MGLLDRILGYTRSKDIGKRHPSESVSQPRKRKLISEERLTRKYSLKQLLKMQDKFFKCL